MNILEMSYCKYDIYPDIKVNDVIKIAVNAVAKDNIKVSNGILKKTTFERIDEYKYKISFGNFKLETFKVEEEYFLEGKKINSLDTATIIKIPYNDQQYFLMYLYDHEKELLKYHGDIKDKSMFTYSCIVELYIDPSVSTGLSKLYFNSYLKDAGEPEENSLTHYLLKNFFIDWKVKTIKEPVSKKYLDDTMYKGHLFTVELEHQDFINSYDNVIYDT